MATELIGTLKDISLGFGVVGFTYWQWTMWNYKFRPQKMCGFTIPFSLIWTILYGCIAVSWALLLFKATAAHVYVLTNTILVLVNLVLNKAWTVIAADMPIRYPAYGRMLTIWAFVILICVLGTATAYIVLTALDANWFAFGFSLPYGIWLVIATMLAIRDARETDFKPLVEPKIVGVNDYVNMDSLIRTTTEKKMPHSGLKYAV